MQPNYYKNTGPGIMQVFSDEFKNDWRLFYDPKIGEFRIGKSDDNQFKFVQLLKQLFPKPIYGVEKCQLQFDQNSLPIIVFVKNGTTYIRRFEGGQVSRTLFQGSDQTLFSNIKYVFEPQDRDVFCFYLQSGLMKYRVQRDNFGAEYPLYQGSYILSGQYYLAPGDNIYKNILHIDCDDLGNFIKIKAQGIDDYYYEIKQAVTPIKLRGPYQHQGSVNIQLLQGFLLSDIAYGPQQNEEEQDVSVQVKPTSTSYVRTIFLSYYGNQEADSSPQVQAITNKVSYVRTIFPVYSQVEEGVQEPSIQVQSYGVKYVRTIFLGGNYTQQGSSTIQLLSGKIS